MATLDLSGRVALVTGASRGIGLESARRLADAGANVVLTARSVSDDVLQGFDAIRPGCATAICGAIDDPAFVRDLLKQVFSRHKRLDVLVNNAGIMKSGVMGMIPDADIRETLDVNLAASLHVMQASSRLMTRTGGSIINISSIVGTRGSAGQMVYAASKAGIIGATLSAARELAPKQVRVNALAPGYIETQMTGELGESLRHETIARIGMERAGSVADVADVVLFLASDLSRYVTGQVIGVDGGMTL